MDAKQIEAIRARDKTFAEQCEYNCQAPADIRALLAEVDALRDKLGKCELRKSEMVIRLAEAEQERDAATSMTRREFNALVTANRQITAANERMAKLEEALESIVGWVMPASITLGMNFEGRFGVVENIARAALAAAKEDGVNGNS
jgi:hypothetical protein